jgi:hypothetical protein
MSLSVKATKNLVTACAAAATLGAFLAPSNAFAVTTWNWSFTTNIADHFGSGTFTTADVVPAANTDYVILAISGTHSIGGNTYQITGIDNWWSPQKFRWNGTSSSPILRYNSISDNNPISYKYNQGKALVEISSDTPGWNPISKILDTGTAHGEFDPILSSSLAPASPPPPSAVPGPLPLLGAAAALQASRRLRRRLKGSLPAA